MFIFINVGTIVFYVFFLRYGFRHLSRTLAQARRFIFFYFITSNRVFETMSRTRSLKLTLEDLPVEATADGPAPLRVEIFNSIRASGVETKTIEGIECLSQKLWFVVFYERRHRNIYENKQIK